MYMYLYIYYQYIYFFRFFSIIGLLQDIESSSLCYTVGPWESRFLPSHFTNRETEA